jgi:hypothetical protein
VWEKIKMITNVEQIIVQAVRIAVFTGDDFSRYPA